MNILDYLRGISFIIHVIAVLKQEERGGEVTFRGGCISYESKGKTNLDGAVVGMVCSLSFGGGSGNGRVFWGGDKPRR